MESLHSILNLLGYAFAKQKDYQQAEKHFAQSVAKSSGFAYGYYNLGLSELRQQKYAEAKAAFERALKQDNDLAKARYNLGVTEGKLGNFK